jgi:hypothetical protein
MEFSCRNKLLKYLYMLAAAGIHQHLDLLIKHSALVLLLKAGREGKNRSTTPN